VDRSNTFTNWQIQIFLPKMSIPVVLDYDKLVDPNLDLGEYIAKAFGNTSDCLGICIVSGVPSLLEKRERLLKLASKLAALDEKELLKLEHQKSNYSFGWSHGKEMMNGKADLAKGSFYNNPMYNDPVSHIKDYATKFPEYSSSNIWPIPLPELEGAFMELGSLIIQVGLRVAYHCDKYLNNNLNDLPQNFLQEMIKDSITHKARLLHYFPISPEDAGETPDGKNIDSWCGIHVDHSVLTGLTAAMYVDESTPDFKQIDLENAEIKRILSNAGLYIKDRHDNFTQVQIPPDCLAFQIGESAQIASEGLLVATPHLVRGASYADMARNTFAVFMQPNVDTVLKPGYGKLSLI
jgi:isopenicillin N synthase-like dioxygenase